MKEIITIRVSKYLSDELAKSRMDALGNIGTGICKLRA